MINMDFKNKYEEETKQNPYCWNESGQYVRSGSYNDGYVKWLEEQLHLHSVVGRSEQLCECKCEESTGGNKTLVLQPLR